jgi:hypothetical protein
MNVNSHKSLHLTQNAKDEFALFENDITNILSSQKPVSYSSNMQSGLVTCSLEISKVSHQITSPQYLVCPYKQEKRGILSLIHAFLIHRFEYAKISNALCSSSKLMTTRPLMIFSILLGVCPFVVHSFRIRHRIQRSEPI